MDEVKKIDTRDSVRTVTANSFITAKGLENLSLKARKMLYIAISQCCMKDKDFYTYEINVTDFANLMGITPQAVYTEADRITDELMSGFLRVVPEGKKNYKKYSLFSTCEYEHDGVLRFKLNPDMTTFLLQLSKNFSQPLLHDFLKMRSPYSMAIWHLMQREMDSQKPGVSKKMQIDLSLDELREITGTQDKLKQISEFKSRVFNKALKEIDDNCGVKITYVNKKKGRTVVGFTCTIESPYYVDPSKIPQELKNKARMIKLRVASATRALTPEEQEEYDSLTANCQQIELKF